MTTLEPESHHRRPPPYEPINAAPLYWTFAVFTLLLGAVCVMAPKWWFGPTWSYFPQLPHNGTGLGLCCIALGSLQMLGLWRRVSATLLAIPMFLIAFVYWTSAMTLLMEGLLGKKGLMESWFIFYVSGHQLVHSAILMRRNRRKRKR